MNILIIEDHTLMRYGLKTFLEGQNRGYKVEAFSRVEPAEEALQQRQFDLAFIDLEIPPTYYGTAILSKLQPVLEGTPVVVLSGSTDPSIVNDCVDCGAMGFVTKSAADNEVSEAIALILDGGVFISKKVSRVQALSSSSYQQYGSEALVLKKLSPREQLVLKLLIRGLPNKVIAVEMGIADNTVKAHLSAIYRKLGAKNRTQAVYFAARAGIPLEFSGSIGIKCKST